MPLLLVAAGIGSVCYGVWGHIVPVVEKPAETAESTEAEPPPPPPPPPPGDPWMSGPPQGDPWMNQPPEAEDDEAAVQSGEEETAPEPPKKTITDEPEPALIREVTVGGVARSASGEIVRTYAALAGEKPASLCPT